MSTKKTEINSVNLSFATNYMDEARYNFINKDGEHYKLLAYISHMYNNTTIYDIGSYLGYSAVALSMNQTNQVVSYDIDWFIKVGRPHNVEFRVGDCFKDPLLLKSPFIVVDVDPHNGMWEKQFVEYLEKNEYKGNVFFDDIHLNEGMQKFWDELKQPKDDLTEFGHWSGSGLVYFR